MFVLQAVQQGPGPHSERVAGLRYVYRRLLLRYHPERHVHRLSYRQHRHTGTAISLCRQGK